MQIGWQAVCDGIGPDHTAQVDVVQLDDAADNFQRNVVQANVGLYGILILFRRRNPDVGRAVSKGHILVPEVVQRQLSRSAERPSNALQIHFKRSIGP